MFLQVLSCTVTVRLIGLQVWISIWTSSHYPPRSCRGAQQGTAMTAEDAYAQALWHFFEERFRGRLPPCSGDAKSLEGRTTLGKAPLDACIRLQHLCPGCRAGRGKSHLLGGFP